jgi:hypothetical protein
MRMFRTGVVVLVAAGMSLGLLGGPARAENKTVRLSGFDEVPVVITDATGILKVFINSGDGTIGYVLTYEGLGQGETVTQAHIHLGQQHTTGNIVVFLCTNLGNAPPSPTNPTPACPPAGTPVVGTLDASNVISFPAQGVGPGDIAAVIDALREGVAYANVHSTVSASGVIRGQFFGKH